MGAEGALEQSGDDGGGQPARSAADVAILEAVGQNDYRGALTLCIREHGAAIGRLCMALLGSQAEADDLTQETLLAAYDGFDDFRGDGSLRAWLSGIARRKCARQLERRTRQSRRLRLVYDATKTDDAEDLVHKRQRAERARAALAECRPSEREALVLRFAGELSFREIGLACGIDERAARKRVSRALARLRDRVATKE